MSKLPVIYEILIITLYLLRFDFTLKYILGTKMRKIDRLNRRLDQKIEIEKDNENQILIKEQWIYSLVEVVIEGSKVNIIEKIKIARRKNKKVVKVVKCQVWFTLGWKSTEWTRR